MPVSTRTRNHSQEAFSYPVDQPEIVPIQRARVYFPATLQRTHRLVGVEECLRVRRVEVANTSAA
jgi:hypothetical protein